MAANNFIIHLNREEINTALLALATCYADEVSKSKKETDAGYEGFHTLLAGDLFKVMGIIADVKRLTDENHE